MNGFARQLRALSLLFVLLSLVSCQKIFGEFTINDGAFDPPGQSGPIRLGSTKACSRRSGVARPGSASF